MIAKTAFRQNWWEYPIQYVKGVGPKRSSFLSRLGIKTVGHLLYHFPRRYEDRSRVVPISGIRVGEIQTVKGEIIASGTKKTYRGYTILNVVIDDGTGRICATWFNQPYLEKQFSAGSSVYLSGRVNFYGEIQIVNPAFEIITEKHDPLQSGCIVPIYPLTENINQRQMRMIYKNTHNMPGSNITEFLPFSIRERHKLTNLPQALRKIHFPETEEDWKDARRRLIFDEFFLMQIALARRKSTRLRKNGISHVSEGHLFKKFKNNLPFPLTGAQDRVIGEITRDMGKRHPMNRLVQGEVGSGKTIAAIGAILKAAENGYQSALMAPTEILAEQHFLTLQKLLIPVGIRISILTSSLSREIKEETVREIRTCQCDVVVGTHALIEESVKFNNLGIVIVDEQHKFGVRQRETLMKKGFESCDLLMMTATPIPRSLAMTVYGDLDISTIDELPPGRGGISTYLISDEERQHLYDFIRHEIKSGRQAYIVYPLVKESETSTLKSAVEMAERFNREIFPEVNICLLHGKMHGKEKEKIMRSFKKNEIGILVCTTVVEVGIDVPNASVMVIENAEQFGLAQLHQMRGRVGRGSSRSYCILVGNAKTEEAKKRLKILAETTDGFQIAEEDLELRGPGEFMGTLQHGMPELMLGSFSSDMKLLEIARKEAFSLVLKDPELGQSKHGNLKIFVREKFYAKP